MTVFGLAPNQLVALLKKENSSSNIRSGDTGFQKKC